MVESYVLGLASADERREFEQLCRQYPELLEARKAFELALEKQAMDNAIAPPDGIKETVLADIRRSTIDFETTQETATVIPMKSGTAGWFRWAAAAVILLLAGSLYFNFSLYNKNKKLQTDYDNNIARLNDLENDMSVLRADPDVKMAKMKGMQVSPQSYATVYWDTASHDVYLLANNLPTPPSDMQYQLWALLDGKPVDLGMLDYDIYQNKLLVRMKNVQDAQAFAITLEKKDRTDTSKPEGNMYVMGGME